MFNPGFGEGQDAEAVETETGESSANDASGEDILLPKLGDAELFRTSNERHYNIQYLEKKGVLRAATEPALKDYEVAAKRLTEHRRALFKEIRELERAKPAAERRPHYLDIHGTPRPYSTEAIARHREAQKVPIPRSELTYQQWKDKGATEVPQESDSLGHEIDPTLRDKTLNKIADIQSLEPLFDVFELAPEKAIKKVTVADILALLKNDVPVDVSMESGPRHMHNY